MTAFWKALVVIFMSEMGDKSQIMSFNFATRYSLLTVVPALFMAIGTMLGISAVIGKEAGALLPVFWLKILAGMIFLTFGLLSLRPDHDDDEEKTVGKQFGPFIAIYLTFIIAEFGDKTVFATIAMASETHQFIPVWIGGTVGMFAADVLAIVVAKFLHKQLPEGMLKKASAAMFLGMGAWILVNALLGSHGV